MKFTLDRISSEQTVLQKTIGFIEQVNWCFQLSLLVFNAVCYWQMQNAWIALPLPDVIIKMQTLLFGNWVIWRRTFRIAFVKGSYLVVYQLPFKTILRMDEIHTIGFKNDYLRIQMKNGTELHRYYLFFVYPRLTKDISFQKLLMML